MSVVSLTARPEPFDSSLILSLSKDERLAQDVLAEGRARGSTGSPRAFLHGLLAGVVVLIIWRLKRYYADARVDDLRWILDPTTRGVAALTGARFEWDAGQGYFCRERLFVIAKVCAGINFLIAAFGLTAWMLARRVVSVASLVAVLAVSLLTAYAAAVVVNAARISVALWLAAHPGDQAWMTAAQAHRVDGIAFYFGGLLLLYAFLIRFERRSMAAPLMWYYAITIVIPLLNGAAASGLPFVEHTLFVLILPLLFFALAALCMLSIHACTSRKLTRSCGLPWLRCRAVRLRWETPRLPRPRSLRRSSSQAHPVNPAA
jgi:exosortase K